MNLFQSLFSPTKRNLVRWRYAAISFGGLIVCFILDDALAAFAWILGWIYGMEWQRVKTADGLTMRANDESD